MYKNKKKSFNALCWHYDEAEKLPKETKVLASNEISQFQSISFEVNQSSIWAVQYHPEFDPKWIAGLMKQREEILLKEKVFTKKKFFDEELQYFSNYKNIHDENYIEKYKDLINTQSHTLELSNWIKILKY